MPLGETLSPDHPVSATSSGPGPRLLTCGSSAGGRTFAFPFHLDAHARVTLSYSPGQTEATYVEVRRTCGNSEPDLPCAVLGSSLPLALDAGDYVVMAQPASSVSGTTFGLRVLVETDATADSCSSAPVLPIGTTVSGVTGGGTSLPPSSCSGGLWPAPAAYHAIRIPPRSELTIASSPRSAQIYVLDGCDGTLCVSSSASLGGAVRNVSSMAFRTVVVGVLSDAPIRYSLSTSVSAIDTPIAAGSRCSDARPLALGISFGDATGAGGSLPDSVACVERRDQGIVFRTVAVPPHTRVSVTLTAGRPAVSPALYLLDGCEPTACLQRVTGGLPPTMVLVNDGDAGRTDLLGLGVRTVAPLYTLPDVGRYTIEVRQDPIPSGATCATATDITAVAAVAQPIANAGDAVGLASACGSSEPALWYRVRVPARSNALVRASATSGTVPDLQAFTSCERVVCAGTPIPSGVQINNATDAERSYVVAARATGTAALFDVATTIVPQAAGSACADAPLVQMSGNIPIDSTTLGSTLGCFGDASTYRFLRFEVPPRSTGVLNPPTDVTVRRLESCSSGPCDGVSVAGSFLFAQMVLPNPGDSVATFLVAVGRTSRGVGNLRYGVYPVQANGACADATLLTGAVTVRAGGGLPGILGNRCETSLGALYFAVDVPAGQRVTVPISSTGSPQGVLAAWLRDCSPTGCWKTPLENSLPDAANDTGTSQRYLLAVAPADPSGSLTVGPPAFAPLAANAYCGAPSPLPTTATAIDATNGGGEGLGGAACFAGVRPRYFQMSQPAHTLAYVEALSTSAQAFLQRVTQCAPPTCDPRVFSTGPNQVARLLVPNDSDEPRSLLVSTAVYAPSLPVTGRYSLYGLTLPLGTAGTCATAPDLTAMSVPDQSIFAGGGLASGDGWECDGTANPSLFYRVSVPARSAVTARFQVDAGNVVVRSIHGCDGTCDAIQDSAPAGQPEVVDFVNESGTPEVRLLAVTRREYQAGPGLISASASPPLTLATNTTCAAAGSLSSGPLLAQSLARAGTVNLAGVPGCTVPSGSRTLYYGVSLAPMTRATVTVVASGFSPVVHVLDACDGGRCERRAVSTGTTVSIDAVNGGSSSTWKIIAVSSASSATGMFTISANVARASPDPTEISVACEDLSSGATVLGRPTRPSEVGPLLALPFAFQHYGTAVTHYSVTGAGFLQLWPSAAGTPFFGWPGPDFSSAPPGAVSPLWVSSGGTVTVRTRVFGTAPDRTFVVGWRNDVSTGLYFEFQAKLFETTKVVEFAYCWLGDAVGTGTLIGTRSVDGLQWRAVENLPSRRVSMRRGFRFLP